MADLFLNVAISFLFICLLLYIFRSKTPSKAKIRAKGTSIFRHRKNRNLLMKFDSVGTYISYNNGLTWKPCEVKRHLFMDRLDKKEWKWIDYAD